MKRQILTITITLIGGIFLGWILFHSSPSIKELNHDHEATTAKSEIWTCSMHPQIKIEKPGKCPICAMDLIPLLQSGTAGMDAASIHLTKEAAQLANVMTAVVSRQQPVKEVRLYGKVQADERLLQNQVAFIPGRIEKLLVNFTGESIRKGQPLALIYSPELVTAQQELLEAAKSKQSQPEIYGAVIEKLRQWKLTDAQITEIEKSGHIKTALEVLSTTSGIVTARRINNGDYVSPGTILYEISDLSRVWVMFDAYESDLPFLRTGDNVDFSIQALPGSAMSGKIQFIDQVIDPTNRVAKVRLEIGNPGAKIKPEMFATGIVKANLSEYRDKLIVPQSAVLWTGKRSVVYVKQPNSDEPVFKMREIELGPKLGDSYVVMDGLADGEEIVIESAFSVDAAAQLEGKPSMMNNDFGTDRKLEHQQQEHIQTSISGKNIRQLKIKVYGNCEMCKERIENAAKSVSGVISASWNSADKLLAVSIDASKTGTDMIQKSIADSGHDTQLYKAKNEVYNKLPECCLYRSPK